MILIIDNYDSFVHNLARYTKLAGQDTLVKRNDALTVTDIKHINPKAIIISPGPCTPAEAGIATDLVRQLGSAVPVLGVCLGHQCIAEAYGGKTIRTRPVHGKPSAITHDGTGLFENLPSPLTVGRYHSLITELPEGTPLTIQARTEDGTVMAFAHRADPVYGVQFHPESILTDRGLDLIRNFINIAQNRTMKKKAA